MRTSSPSSSSSSSTCGATRARALAPQSCFATLHGPAAGGGAGAGAGGAAAGRAAGDDGLLAVTAGVRADASRAGGAVSEARRSRLLVSTRGAAAEGADESSSRVGEPLLALADEGVEHRRVRGGASARRARLEHVSELHQQGHGARPIARAFSFRLHRGCAEGVWGGEGALARGWRRGERSGHSCALGEGARFLSDCARATHRRVQSSPIRLRVAAVSLIVVARRVSLSPVDSDARRALRRAQVRDRDGRRGRETSKILLSMGR